MCSRHGYANTKQDPGRHRRYYHHCEVRGVFHHQTGRYFSNLKVKSGSAIAIETVLLHLLYQALRKTSSATPMHWNITSPNPYIAAR